MKIALVHDYLAQDGGAERVLSAMHDLWPDAPIFVLFHNRQRLSRFNEADIRESFLRHIPLINQKYQWFLPLFPMAAERLNLSGFDVVISSTSGFGKGVITDPDTLHISYCYTPPRYLWADRHSYLADSNTALPIRFFLSPVLHHLRTWDMISAARVDHFIAISKIVQKRIQKYYRRESDVLYPPVDLDRFTPAVELHDYFVAGGRLVPYKRFDLVVKAFNRLRLPLVIFGTGPEYRRLKALARDNITFAGQVNDTEKATLLSHALAFIHPQLEDFGITLLEALASGRPVIAYDAGGAAETMLPGETGVFIKEQSWEAIADAVLHFDPTHWNSALMRRRAEQFAVPIFQAALKKMVADRYEEFQKGFRQNELIKG